MKKSFKTLWIFLLGIVMAAAIVGLSACSLLVSYLDDDDSSSSSSDGGSSSGGSTTSGTYTLDVTVYDVEWYSHVVDTTSWTTTANVDAYAYDELTLYSDGTYELIKTMGAGDEAVTRWGGGTEKHFIWYAYYGTYTQSGNDVTLSECTSIGVEVQVFTMMLDYHLGNEVIEKMTTTDLTQTAGCCGDETVVDLMYSALIVDSGYGNCSQVVTLGTYDWGTFTFSGLANADEDDGDSGDGGDTITIAAGGYTFTSGTNDEIIFIVYADGTYVFAWPSYNVSENGTYTWDRLTQTLTIYDPTGTSYTADVSGDEISFTYYYSASSALLQDYTGSIEEMEDVICDAVYEFIPETDASVTLTLYSDETYTYADSANGVRETGTYSWDANDNVLVLTLPDGETTISSTVSGNLLKISYTSLDNSSSQNYIASLSEASKVLPSAELVFSFTPASGNSAIYLDLYDDGTYIFGFSTYSLEEAGTWSYMNNTLTLTRADGVTTFSSEISDGVISLYYDYGGGLDQTFTGDVLEMNEALGVAYMFTPGSGNQTIYLTLFTDGTYEFGFTTYGLTDAGTWSCVNGIVTLTKSDGVTTFISETDGDDISLYYDYGGGLDQTFKGTVSGINEAFGIIYMFTPGSGNSAIYLYLYKDGTFEFGFTTYGLTESGTWTYANGTLAFTMDGDSTTTMTATVDGDKISVYYDYAGAGQLTQTFIGSVSDIQTAAGIIYSMTPGSGNSAIYLNLYEDGTFEFGFMTYGLTESGTWTYANGTLVFSMDGDSTTTMTATVDGDTISVYYDYAGAGQLTQTFTGSVSDIQTAAGIIYSFTPGSGNSAIYLNLYEDGTFEFGFMTYGLTETGTWTYVNGTLTFTMDGDSATTMTATVDGDSLSVYYDYSAYGQLTQTFIGSVSEIQEAVGMIYAFTPGSGNSAIYLNLFDDGTFEFGFTSYGVTENGTWTYASGSLVFAVDSSTIITVTTADGVVSIYYDYMSLGQLTQTFTGTASEVESAVTQ